MGGRVLPLWGEGRARACQAPGEAGPDVGYTYVFLSSDCIRLHT